MNFTNRTEFFRSTATPSVNVTYTSVVHTSERTFKQDVDWQKTSLEITAALLIALVNGFIILLFLKKSSLKTKPANRILLSLAACDFTFGTSITVHITHSLLHAYSTLSSLSLLAFSILANILSTILQISAVLHLLVIAGERYISLFFPFEHRIYVTNESIHRIITIVWITAITYPLIQFSWLYKRLQSNISTEDLKLINLAESVFSGLTASVFLLGPSVVLAGAYIRMVFRVHRIMSDSRNVRGLDQKAKEPNRKEQKAVYIFATMYVLFMILALPFFVVRVLIDFAGIISFDLTQLSLLTLDALYLSRCCVSFLNPIVYIGCKNEVRKEAVAVFANLFRRARREDNNIIKAGQHIPVPHTSGTNLQDEKQDPETILTGFPDEHLTNTRARNLDGIELLPIVHAKLDPNNRE